MNEISISLNLITAIFVTSTLLVIGVCLFFIGYFIGKQSNYGVFTSIENRPKGFFTQEAENKAKSKITIDDKKFVTDIRTDGLEKKYDQLGELKTSTDSITNSVNKLKNMKR
jgi:hypothetical protein